MRILVFLSLLFLCGRLFAADPDGVRPPAVAGRFYPASPQKLEAAVRAFLADALPPRDLDPIALVLPHAGYIFSGQIAADGFRQAQNRTVDTVVILGTNHTVPPFEGISVFQGAGYRTPLGVARSDKELAALLVAADKAFSYRPEAHVSEHSEEVQVPFVQVVFPGAKIVTAVVGSASPVLAERFGRALARAAGTRRLLIVASSDLSHYPGYGDAVAVDRRTLEAAATLDPATLAASVARSRQEGHPGLETCACGQGPIVVAAAAAKALGATRGVVLSYANSGDTVVGEYGRVVGYGSLAFVSGASGPDTTALAPLPAAAGGPLSASDRQYLLALARTTLERYFRTETLPLPRPTSAALRQMRGAFVTLKASGDLRGCIGHMAQDTPLALTVARMALEAALRDPRFQPVRADELEALHLEISALTPFTAVPGYGSIVVGRDGVLLEKAGRHAVFLPQVAPEEGWSREEMLRHLSLKAGLPEDAWQQGCTFQTFQAEVFGEEDPHR